MNILWYLQTYQYQYNNNTTTSSSIIVFGSFNICTSSANVIVLYSISTKLVPVLYCTVVFNTLILLQYWVQQYNSTTVLVLYWYVCMYVCMYV